MRNQVMSVHVARSQWQLNPGPVHMHGVVQLCYTLGRLMCIKNAILHIPKALSVQIPSHHLRQYILASVLNNFFYLRPLNFNIIIIILCCIRATNYTTMVAKITKLA